MTTAYRTIKFSSEGAIVQITLNRPETHNAIDIEAHHELKSAFDRAATTDGTRVIVLAANGKSFSAGGDFDQILADRQCPTTLCAMEPEGRALLTAIGDCPLPVVTALHGDAAGLGATLMLATDAVVAARTARISDPHVVIGLGAGDGGAVMWPLNAGLLRAKRYLLTGDRLSAEDAFMMGLVTDLVDSPEQVLPEARALAERIAALPPLAVAATKRTLNQIFRQRMEAVYELGIALEMRTFVSGDVVEAIAAFRERRKPVYRGT